MNNPHNERVLTTTGESTPDLYDYCTGQNGANATAKELLLCVTTQLQSNNTYVESSSEDNSFAKTLFLVLAAALAFFMQAGFAMVCAGAVRKKNVRNTMMKNLLDACGAAVAFFAVGFAFAYGGDDKTSSSTTFIGTSNFFLHDVDKYAFFLFQYAFSAASATIVAGTLAERCQMAAYLCYSVMLTGWVYPVVAHSIWSPQGFLSANSIDPLWGVGMIDFAGSAVVHVTGGITALFATTILGPRRGRFVDDSGRPLETPRDFPGHSQALQMLGTFILWFGWYGFNSGSALTYTTDEADEIAALAGVNTTLAAGMAGITALFFNLFLLERYTGEPYFDLKYAMNGALCGLVSITAGCGVFEPWAGVVTGFFAGLIYCGTTRLLVKLRLDDAVDAIPVHFFGGAWGALAVGFFAAPRHLRTVYDNDSHPGLFYTWRNGGSDARLLGIQTVGLLFIIGWVMAIMLPFFVWLDWRGWFRSDPLEEIVGLDTSYHGGLYLTTADDESVNPEALEELRKRRSEHAKNRLQNSISVANNNSGTGRTSPNGQSRTELAAESDDPSNEFEAP